jgi:hypothetical protein
MASLPYRYHAYARNRRSDCYQTRSLPGSHRRHRDRLSPCLHIVRSNTDALETRWDTERQRCAWENMACILSALRLSSFATQHYKPPFVVPINGSTHSYPDFRVPFCASTSVTADAAITLLNNSPIFPMNYKGCQDFVARRGVAFPSNALFHAFPTCHI